MNYAVLNKYRAGKWEISRICDFIRNNSAKIHSYGYSETSIYLSYNKPDICFVVSFWFSKKAMEEFFNNPSHKIYGMLPEAAYLEESIIFQLGKEWRQLHLQPGASTICISQLPTVANIQSSQDNARNLFKLRNQQKGLIGAWWGYSIQNPQKMFARLDWQTLKDQHNYFSNPATQNIITHRLDTGFKLEYASLTGNQLIFPVQDLELHY